MKPILLRTQYRCHPLISSISNRLFYNDQLLDGVNAEERKPLVDFIPTLCFYDVANGKEECSQDGSYFNTSEAKFVVTLIKSLLESEIEPKQIGVISQYKSQLTAINNSLSADGATSQKELAGIQISTVDAFQGGEKDVIILSCVRTKHIGFIDCERRTNVALTRAKRHLCIVGRGKMLSSNALWKKILTICRDSPLGLQSSESYVKEWKERRPKTDGSSSGPKKRRNSRKGGGPGGIRTTPKLSNRTLTGQTVDTCKSVTASGQTKTKRPASIELNEIFESNSNVACGENDCDDIDWGPTITISDNDPVPEAFDDNDDIINTNEDEFLNSDNDVKEIEILSDSRLDVADDNIGECCEGKKDLGREETAGKQVHDLGKNCCSEYVFDDDFLLDSELCNMEY
ncbi:protein ZGRF1-like [Dendronephthya gigantea]|uniref:protein ZGRF1-like n=1 Tax=Dendronephthya gigantea TaxID=151771 RepID=UPI00106DA0C9|nr:protein ZGRF1-like [Dendronephthya gigantea]